MSEHQTNEACPCGRGLFATCCKPKLEDHSQVKTAEELMRARYAAFCQKDLDFSLKTYLTEKPRSTIITNFGKIFEERIWHHLTITECVDGGEQDDAGIVQFYAVYSHRDEPHVKQFTHERSTFSREEDGLWYFRSSQSFKQVGLAPESDCWCGSGKSTRDCHPDT